MSRSLLFLFFISLVFYLDWKFNRLYLTNFRLIKERGIIGKRFMSIRLEGYRRHYLHFRHLGKIFGYGDLTIESAGTQGKMVFKGISKAKEDKTISLKDGCFIRTLSHKALYSSFYSHISSLPNFSLKT